MPDIAMCNSTECPKRYDCYRHEALPDPFMQTWGDFDEQRDGGNCEYWWPLKPKNDDRSMAN